MKFGIASSLELFKDDFVSATARINECSCDDCQRSATFDVSSATEEFLRFDERRSVNATRTDLARIWHCVVVSTRETSDRVEKDDNMLAALDHASRFFNHHFGNLNVTRSFFVECACHNFNTRWSVAFEIGDFFRTLIDQQNDCVNIGMIGRDCICNLLKNDCLSSARRRDNQSALTESEWRDHVDDSGFDACWLVQHLQVDASIGMKRSQVFEDWKRVHGRWIKAVDCFDAK